MSSIESAIKNLSDGFNLTASEMEDVMRQIMTETVDTQKIVSFLEELNKSKETSGELIGTAKVMRELMVKINTTHKIVLDTCGTGGDRKHTFNISTAAAFVAAGAGVAVAKHGNRSVSSKVGSADVLEALGVNINMPPETAENCLEKIGITFLFAPNFHPAMKSVMPARKQIAAKTIFNFLGPLVNPAGAKFQLVGVCDSLWASNLATALKVLGTEHALVVRCLDGTDEITTKAKTLVYEVYKGHKIIREEIDFSEFGFKKTKPGDLNGPGSAEGNAAIITDILSGKKSLLRDAVVLNAAAALYAASDRTDSLKDGIREKISLAEEAIDSGRALEKLELLKKYSR